MSKAVEALHDLKNYAEKHATRVDNMNGGLLCRACVEESANIVETALMEGLDDRAVLHLIFSKRVDLKIVAWASPSVEAYNKNIAKDHSFHREPLTKEEFKMICIYGRKLDISGFCWFLS